MPIEYGKRYVRIRIRNPNMFINNSLRTLDIGRPKRHMLIRGRLKGAPEEWRTQAVLVEREIWKKDRKITKEIIKGAKINR